MSPGSFMWKSLISWKKVLVIWKVLYIPKYRQTLKLDHSQTTLHFNSDTRKITHYLWACVLLCVVRFDGTYRVEWAGASRAAQGGWHCGSGQSCRASCSSYRRTPELWPPCCWTKGAPPSRWWATGAGSWLSSDCAKAWFGSAWLRVKQRGEEEVEWSAQYQISHPAFMTMPIYSALTLQPKYVFQPRIDMLSSKWLFPDNWRDQKCHALSCVTLLHFVASYLRENCWAITCKTVLHTVLVCHRCHIKDCIYWKHFTQSFRVICHTATVNIETL